MQESLKCEREMEIVQFGQPAISYNSMAAFPWMITKNSISPELSMKLLNLFYALVLICFYILLSQIYQQLHLPAHSFHARLKPGC